MFFGFEVSLVSRVFFNFQGNPFNHLKAMPLDADNFSGIVGHQSHVSNPKHVEHLGSHTIISQIFLESKPVVGFDCVDPIFLKLIGFQFIEQSNSSPFLGKIKDYPFSPSRSTIIIAACNWGPQSQRNEPNTSPVRHSEWTRTNTGSSFSHSPLTSAT